MLEEFEIYKTDSQLAYGGVIIKYSFMNGYGASISKHKNSYGHENDLWELAVLKNNEITYDTHLTGNVLGFLTDEDVKEYFNEIIRLED